MCKKNDVSHAERRLTGHDTFLKRCNEEIQTDGNARKRFFIPHFTLFFFSFFFLLFTTNVTRYIMAHSMAVATMYFNKRFTFFLLFFQITYISLLDKLILASSFFFYPRAIRVDRGLLSRAREKQTQKEMALRKDPSISVDHRFARLIKRRID